MTEGVGASQRKPYSGRPHQSHCSCFYEVERSRAAVKALRQIVLLARDDEGSPDMAWKDAFQAGEDAVALFEGRAP